MEKITLTISPPRTMKAFTEKQRGGRFSTPSEYLRSLSRGDHDLNCHSEVAELVHRVQNRILPSRRENHAEKREL